MNGKPNVEPAWMSLKRLVETRMVEILRKEQDNKRYIRLYGTEDYWHAFEESAFQLERLFRKGETTLFRHKDYPFPVVMVSIPDSELRAYIQQHIPVCDKHDYKKLLVAEFSAAEYRAWHEHAVKEFL